MPFFEHILTPEHVTGVERFQYRAIGASTVSLIEDLVTVHGRFRDGREHLFLHPIGKNNVQIPVQDRDPVVHAVENRVQSIVPAGKLNIERLQLFNLGSDLLEVSDF
jgi:hypothetical protein